MRENITRYALNPAFQQPPTPEETPCQEESSFSSGTCSLSDRNSELDPADELNLY